MALLTGIAQAQSGRCLMNGIVVGERDYPKDATVTLIGDPDNGRIRNVKLTAKVDEKGKYTLKEIPYGDNTLRVSVPGYATYQISIYMLPDATTQVRIKLKREKAPAKEKQ